MLLPHYVLSHPRYILCVSPLQAIELETGRILITNYLTLMLWRILDLSPLDLLPSVFLSLNHLAPPYENLQLHIGGSIVGRCVRDVTGRSREQMRDDYQSNGATWVMWHSSTRRDRMC